jgi:endoglucanase
MIRWRWAPLALALALSTTAQAAVPLRGVNLSGLELNPAQLPGRLNLDFVAPTQVELAQAQAAHFTLIRLPVEWARLQPRLSAPLDPAMLATLKATIAAAERDGLQVVIDIHDYGSYRGAQIGSPSVPVSAFADLWTRLARVFAADPRVIFGLMNEPHDIDAVAWAATEQTALCAIRAAGARNLVLVSGTGWDGAHNFTTGADYGTPNAAALAKLQDPANNMAIELHQYLDADFSGSHPDCTDPQNASALIAPATDWLRAHHRKAFLGEVAASGSPACLASLSAILGAVDAASDAWLGWAYWAGGPWWGDYMFTIDPKNGAERPQMRVLSQMATAK